LACMSGSLPLTPTAVDHRRPDLVGAPLGPGSLTWSLASDARSLLLIGRTGVLQNMHPAVSQALLDHSKYFDDPIARIGRSIGPILGVIYHERPEQTATTVRDWHKPIRSAPDAEQRYRALDPSTFYWTHATFVEANIATQRFYGRPPSRPELEQLYAESITWWRRYGMSMAPVPEHYEDFRRYWDRMLAEQLQATPVALQAVTDTHLPVSPVPLPDAIWRLVGEPTAVAAAVWLTRATLPPVAREILGLSWSSADEWRAQAFFRAVRSAWRGVPFPGASSCHGARDPWRCGGHLDRGTGASCQ